MIRISLRLSAMLLAASALAASLTACLPLMVGGAAMTGLVATDRRTSGAQLEDEGIEFDSRGRVDLSKYKWRPPETVIEQALAVFRETQD